MSKSKSKTHFEVIEHSLENSDGHPSGLTVVELVFCNPGSRNSFQLESARELSGILKRIQSIKARALLFRAEGAFFCSGGNLSDHLKQGKTGGLKANREIATCLKRLEGLGIPTIAVVEGDALGGGLELLSAFDFVFAAPHVLFGFWQRRIGLSHGWGGRARLERRLGAHVTARLALDARAISAEEALRVGLIDQIAASWKIQEDAMAQAARMARLPMKPVAGFKDPKIKGESAERSFFAKLWFAAEHRARLEAFGEKAKPRR
ncbi:MAG: enoyl-CoA hydratase/isomerase family protein [Bdellovibrionales bacterium]|nr:enoyl-CoA hydratase/isomerase family protein [Bdellovibrionales bacterium]